jgi:hypothetical protein
MSDAIDEMLLSREPAPSLSEALSALVQSLAPALAALPIPDLHWRSSRMGLKTF